MKTHTWKIAALALVLMTPGLASAMGELARPEDGTMTQCSRQQKAEKSIDDSGSRHQSNSGASSDDSRSGSGS